MTSAVDSNKQAKRSAAQVEKVIQPVYPLDLDRQPIVLYAGSLTASLKGVNFGQLFDGEGMVLFRLAPEPQMPWTVVAEPVDLPVDVEEELTEGLLPPDFSALAFPDPWADHAIPDLPRQGTNYVQFGGGLRRTEIGEPDMLSELRLSLTGFPLCLGTTDVIYPDCIARPGRISFAVGDWVIDIDIWFDLDRVPFCAPGKLPYSFIRMCRLRKSEGAMFSAREDGVEFLKRALASFLSFTTGRLVGIALPVGLDESGTPKYVEWDSTLFEPVEDFKSWYSHRHPASLEPLFQNFVRRLQEPLWGRALLEAIRQYVAANALWKDFAVGTVTACAALESLTWTVLVQEEEMMSSAKHRSLRAAGRLRDLLSWAQIPVAVPGAMAALHDLAQSKNMDGPAIVFWIRNRIAHPDREAELNRNEVHDAWTVSLWYLELVLLKILGFSGEYRSRVSGDQNAISLGTVPWKGSESEEDSVGDGSRP